MQRECIATAERSCGVQQAVVVEQRVDVGDVAAESGAVKARWPIGQRRAIGSRHHGLCHDTEVVVILRVCSDDCLHGRRSRSCNGGRIVRHERRRDRRLDLRERWQRVDLRLQHVYLPLHRGELRIDIYCRREGHEVRLHCETRGPQSGKVRRS